MARTPPSTTGRPDPSGTLEHLDTLAAEIDRLRRQLEESERLASLGLAAGFIAHEFNHLLTPIRTWAQLALASPDDPDLARRALEHASSGAAKGERIASTILALTGEPDHRAGAPGAGPADVADVVRRVAEAVEPECSARNIRVEVEIEGGLAAAIDPVSLEHVVLNLVLNGMEAVGREGRIGIRGWEIGSARIARRGSSERWVEIVVEDSGRGMSGPELARWFGGEGTGGRAGRGLGLALCRRLVEGAGGRMEAESSPGAGTRVRVVAGRA